MWKCLVAIPLTCSRKRSRWNLYIEEGSLSLWNVWRPQLALDGATRCYGRWGIGFGKWTFLNYSVYFGVALVLIVQTTLKFGNRSLAWLSSILFLITLIKIVNFSFCRRQIVKHVHYVIVGSSTLQLKNIYYNMYVPMFSSYYICITNSHQLK